MNAAISVKSPFSHSALFGFMMFPPSELTGQRIAVSSLHVYNCARRLLKDPCPSVAKICSGGLRRRLICRDAKQLCMESRMDAFSEILSGVKLNGALFFTAEFSAPWGLTAPSAERMAETIAPGAAHLVIYHLLVEGGAVVET